MRHVLRNLFGREVIDGRCPYLIRWRLFATPWFGVYLHRFIASDWSRDLHDHPRPFWSIGL